MKIIWTVKKIIACKHLLFLLVFLSVFDLLGQTNQSEKIVKYEEMVESKRNLIRYYLETHHDTLHFNDQIYFFRRTPLSLRQRYTDIFHSDEILIDFQGQFATNLGDKGYILNWVIRNDSLFIKKILLIYNKQVVLIANYQHIGVSCFTG